MRALTFLSLFIFGIGCAATAQNTSETPGTIQISMNATELVPADQIIFNVTINAEDRTPRVAFAKHQQMETLLADLLKDMNIEEENIRFQPVRISKSYRNNRTDQYSQTNQQVSITFSDFELYEELQITLLENNFDSFNANFSSSHIADGKENALLAAIEAAKEKAQVIAEASGVSLGKVRSINYGDYIISQPSFRADAEMMRVSSAPSMMDFAQTVTVSANINIEFYIKN